MMRHSLPHTQAETEGPNLFWCALGRTFPFLVYRVSLLIAVLVFGVVPCFMPCTMLSKTNNTQLFLRLVLRCSEPVPSCSRCTHVRMFRPSQQHSVRAEAAGRRSGSSHLATPNSQRGVQVQSKSRMKELRSGERKPGREQVRASERAIQRASAWLADGGRTRRLTQRAIEIGEFRHAEAMIRSMWYLGPARMAGALQRQGS